MHITSAEAIHPNDIPERPEEIPEQSYAIAKIIDETQKGDSNRPALRAEGAPLAPPPEGWQSAPGNRLIGRGPEKTRCISPLRR